MIDRVQERGGTQLKYGGDALLSLFTGRDHATQAAVCAAVEMRRAAMTMSDTQGARGPEVP
jgi:class 3 adenylate cyclase